MKNKLGKLDQILTGEWGQSTETIPAGKEFLWKRLRRLMRSTENGNCWTRRCFDLMLRCRKLRKVVYCKLDIFVGKNYLELFKI